MHRQAPGKLRVALFWAGLLGLLAALLVFAPIAQPPRYHAFIDDRSWLGIPHAWNTLSNLPFVLLGAIGLAGVLARGHVAQGASRAGWITLFAGSILVGIGSGWYHLDPTDASLTWDRLAMAVAFAGLFSALVGDYVCARHARPLLWAGTATGFAAVIWWRVSGDLSLWAWVQGVPMLAVVLIVVLFRPGRREGGWLLGALACYVLAKAFELADASAMDWFGGLTGGHALKHFAAAGSVVCFHALLAGRRGG